MTLREMLAEYVYETLGVDPDRVSEDEAVNAGVKMVQTWLKHEVARLAAMQYTHEGGIEFRLE